MRLTKTRRSEPRPDRPYYLRGQFARCEAGKEPYRIKVAEHFAKFHLPGTQDLTYFGLPGILWHTERMLQRQYSNLFCIGVEWDRLVEDHCLDHMPGFNIIKKPVGSESYYESNVSRLHVSSAGDYFVSELSRNDKIDMAWLDLTGRCGSRETLNACRGFAQHLSEKKRIPFAITFSSGRESESEMEYLRLLGGKCPSTKMRVKAIKTVVETHACRPVYILNVEPYRSQTGTARRMVFMVGVIC